MSKMIFHHYFTIWMLLSLAIIKTGGRYLLYIDILRSSFNNIETRIAMVNRLLSCSVATEKKVTHWAIIGMIVICVNCWELKSPVNIS